jgi:ketosteroid isomerase-like protein
VEGQPYLGATGVRQHFEDTESAWARLHWELEEVHEAGERAVVVMRFTAEGKASGAPVDGRTGQVWNGRDGKLWRVVVYRNPDEAFRAAGLRP